MKNTLKKIRRSAISISSVFVILGMLVLAVTLIALSGCGKKKEIQVIFISIDTLRGDHLESYGYFRETAPNLASLVKESAYYPQTYTNGCWTYPSHVSMLTGTLPSRHGINQDWNTLQILKKVPELNSSIKNIAQLFKQNHPQIKTIKFAKLPDSIGFALGFDLNSMLDPFANEEQFNILLTELEKNKDKPFFMFLHTWMVHAPYANSHFMPPDRLDEESRDYIDNFHHPRKSTPNDNAPGKKIKKLGFRAFLAEKKIFTLTDCLNLYDGGIHYVDIYIGKLIDKLKVMGIYDNTMIILVSDHGEHFADHHRSFYYNFHGQDFYDEFIKVPLIIKYPHQERAKTHQQNVSLIDVVPTVMDYYKYKIPTNVQGESLLLEPGKGRHDHVISEATVEPSKERKMLRIGDLKYIITMENINSVTRSNWDNVTERRLFNMKDDPKERENLYKYPKFKATAQKFERMLKQFIQKSATLNHSGKNRELNKETVDHMKSLGYL